MKSLGASPSFAAERVCAALVTWLRAPSAGAGKVSLGDGLPDQLSHVDDQAGTRLAWIARCADLAGADADRVFQPVVGLTVAS
jgi:hypothetical protein